MRVSDGCREFVLEQLSDVKALHARSMFGGIGLYAGDVFFGILAADVLYLKVDDSNRSSYESEGMKPFTPFTNQTMTMSYYEVPVRVLEDRDELARWVRTSIRVAATAAARKKR